MSRVSATRGGFWNAAVRWLKWGLIAAVGLEVGYLAVFNIWIPARLHAFAKSHELNLELTGFRSFYPGDLRADALSLSGPGRSFDITTRAAQGRIKVWALFAGSFDLAWLRVASVSARVKRPGSLLLACSHSSFGAKQLNPPEQAAIGELPSIRQMRVDRAAISIVSAQLGALKLDGQAEVRITEARLAEDSLEMNAFAHFKGVREARGRADDAALAALDGDLAWKIAPRNGAPRSADASRLSARGSMRWKAANLAALLGAGPDIEARATHLAVELRMTDGATRPGSYVELQSEELDSPALQIAPGGALFRHARLRLDLAASSAANDRLAGTFALRSPDVEFQFHGQAQHFAIVGKATIEELNTRTPSLQLSAGQFHAERAESRDPRSLAQQALSLVLTLNRASWSSSGGLRLSGLLVARGSDASALLDLGPPDPAARWMLSELVSAPFSLRVGLLLRPERLALNDITLTTARDNAQGALFLSDAGARGAFLVQRGQLDIGVSVEPDAMKLDIGATRDWLTRSLADLNPPPALPASERTTE